MAEIKLIELRGTTCYTISINKKKFVTISPWKYGYDLLEQFIQECESALLNKDAQMIFGLHKRFKLSSPLNFLRICESAFEKQFIEFFIHCGKKALKNGNYFSRVYFGKMISDFTNKNPLLQHKALFGRAEDIFFDSIAVNELNKAFIERSTVTVCNIYKSLQAGRFFYIAINKLYTQFESYLNFCLDNLFEQNQNVSYSTFCKVSLSVLVDRNKSESGSEFMLKIFKECEAKSLLRNNQQQMRVGQLKWYIPYRDIQVNRFQTLNFSGINPFLLKEIQLYLKYYYKKGESPKSLVRRFSNIRRIALAIQEISPDCITLTDITYIEVLQLFDVLKQTKTQKNKLKYSLKTIQGSISEARLLFDWLKSSNNITETLKNPFRRLRFNNISSFIKSAQYIPDEVVEQLSAVIHECPIYVQRVWLIMMNTGMRVSEVLHLEEDCLVYNDKESVYYLNFISSKNLIQRRKVGFDDYHSVPILAAEIVEIVQQQIEDSAKKRQIGRTKKIFIKYGRKHGQLEKVSGYLNTTVMLHINNIIKRHQIKNRQGLLWHYTNHQCRKTLGVRLLSNGNSIADVGEILGHMEEKTTREYYQDIDAKKIAELDQDLFEQLFESIDDDIQKAYTPSELVQLKKEIMTGVRETPEGHGSCVKHISFGPCKKRSCVGCSLLITGPQKLPMWKNLYAEQQSYIQNMIVQMKKQNIKDYENYRDYQAEIHLLKLYKDTIVKIEKFIEERIPGHGKQ